MRNARSRTRRIPALTPIPTLAPKLKPESVEMLEVEEPELELNPCEAIDITEESVDGDWDPAIPPGSILRVTLAERAEDVWEPLPELGGGTVAIEIDGAADGAPERSEASPEVCDVDPPEDTMMTVETTKDGVSFTEAVGVLSSACACVAAATIVE